LSWRWWRAFGRDVGDEAARHGLVTSGSALSRLWLGLLALLAIPAWMLIVGTGGTGSTGSNDLGSWLAVLSLLIPGFAVYSLARIRYVLTAEGRRVGRTWLGIGRMLSEATFDQQPPAAVRIWGRSLAYATALGLAGHVATGMPFGMENDRHAWSA